LPKNDWHDDGTVLTIFNKENKDLQSSVLINSRQVWNVLGLPFDRVGLLNAIKVTEAAVMDKSALFMSTPNLNFAIATQSDTEFFNSVVESDLSVADGMPLIWVAKLLGVPLTERVAGSTLFDELSKKPRAEKIKVFFFGGQEGVAEQAHKQLNETSLGMLSCGFYDPGFVSVDEMSDAGVIEQINAAKPDFLVVALGAKKGQAWIQKNRALLVVPVISHLGAVINFVAGSIDRAPVLWQRMGLEWLWRIKQEPALWKRYLQDGFAFIGLMLTKVFPLAIYDRFLKKNACFEEPCIIEWLTADNDAVGLAGSLKNQQLSHVKAFLSSIIEQAPKVPTTHDLTLDFSNVSYIDGAFIATLMLFHRQLEVKGRGLVLLNVPTRIKRILTLNNVRQRFVLEERC